MPNYIYSGNRVKFDLELTIMQLEKEANSMLDQLAIEYKRLLSLGYPPGTAQDMVMALLSSDKGPFKTYLNKQKAIIKQMANELVAKPAISYGEENPNQKFKWVLGHVKTNHCNDCIALSQLPPSTIKEWREYGLGLPREGKTECSYGCKCMLLPVDSEETK